jgi:hypothetical protein
MKARGTLVFNSLMAALLTSFGLGFIECLLTGDSVKCKFTASVADTGGNLPLVSLTLAANLSLVLLTGGKFATRN